MNRKEQLKNEIKELMKVCHVIELKTPTKPQVLTIINEFQNLIDVVYVDFSVFYSIHQKCVWFI